MSGRPLSAPRLPALRFAHARAPRAFALACQARLAHLCELMLADSTQTPVCHAAARVLLLSQVRIRRRTQLSPVMRIVMRVFRLGLLSVWLSSVDGFSVQGPLPRTVRGPIFPRPIAPVVPRRCAPARLSEPIPSALAAYGHFLGLVLGTACLTTERLSIKPGMSEEDEDRIVIADATYGLVGLLIAVTGYLRVTQYGKGWEFYSHSPLFWLKMTLVAVMGAASFFPVIQQWFKRPGCCHLRFPETANLSGCNPRRPQRLYSEPSRSEAMAPHRPCPRSSQRDLRASSTLSCSPSSRFP